MGVSRPNRELHYCKHCDTDFLVAIDPEQTGDFHLLCHTCGWKHYRYFYAGEAIHCDITKAKGDIKVLNPK